MSSDPKMKNLGFAAYMLPGHGDKAKKKDVDNLTIYESMKKCTKVSDHSILI